MLCPICQKPETQSKKFYNHYGDVKCCFSCKAFFRRYLKESKKKHPCKFQNNCDLCYTVRKNKCASCRYEKCLEVGMQNELVSLEDSVPLPNVIEVPNQIGLQGNQSKLLIRISIEPFLYY